MWLKWTSCNSNNKKLSVYKYFCFWLWKIYPTQSVSGPPTVIHTAENETPEYTHSSHVWGVCGLPCFHTPPCRHWLLTRDGDHELITAFTFMHTHTHTYTHTLIPGGWQLLNEPLHIRSKNTTLDKKDKQKSLLMKPPPSWFSTASLSWSSHILWDFIQSISHMGPFFSFYKKITKNRFQHYELSCSCCEQWDADLQACGTPHSLPVCWSNTIHVAGILRPWFYEHEEWEAELMVF